MASPAIQLDSAPAAQINLFTGAPEPACPPLPQSGWLFDPDFGFAFPEDRAGHEFVVDEGVSLVFPATPDFHPPASRPFVPVSVGPSGRPIYGKPPFVPDTPSIARTEDAAQLVLSGFGIYLGKTSERLQIKVKGKLARALDGAPYEFPFFRLSEIVIASSGVSLSSDLVREFCARGIRLTFIERSGRPYALLSSPTLTATVESRREQLFAYRDARGLEFARLIVRGKIRNQRHLLLYSAKYLKQSHPERYATVETLARSLRQIELSVRAVTGENLDQRRDQIMGLEGAAGRLYWQGFKTVVEGQADFPGRSHRGATDDLNAMLNYGYGILYAHVWGAVVNAGLEPFAGFLHVDRPGKPSLVLDMVEEFRQPVVDRSIIAFINLGQKVEMENNLLDARSRQAVSQRILDRLAAPEPFRGRHFQIRSIIQMQARALVGFLRGRAPYKPFSFRW